MKIAIIGGGVAGVTTALMLRNLGFSITLFEQKPTLVAGPPFCHLHAGGNLYPQIGDQECIQLLSESIEFARLYPFAIERRPTLIALPTYHHLQPRDILRRLQILKEEYAKLVAEDRENEILGEEYFTIVTKEDLLALKEKPLPHKPKTAREWLIAPAKFLDITNLQFPLFLVNEWGINMFMLSAAANELLQHSHVRVLLDTKITSIERGFVVGYGEEKEHFDYIVNAAGFQSGWIDEALGYERERLVEFKAAYVVQWRENIPFPEMIFHGQRGTPRGMAQFTPYPGGFYQLHGMTKKITLFEDGLTHKELPKKFLEKIERGWGPEERRSQRAIEHFRSFLPNFAKEAKVGFQPLFGAQQIPGNNPELRAAEVSFEKNYARCEIVKVSSAPAMARAIAKNLGKEIPKAKIDLDIEKITEKAKIIASQRGYPAALGTLLYPLS